MRKLTDVSSKKHEAEEAAMTSSRSLALAEARGAEESQFKELTQKWRSRFQIEKPRQMAQLWDEVTKG